jgi:hypothetical protein
MVLQKAEGALKEKGGDDLFVMQQLMQQFNFSDGTFNR